MDILRFTFEVCALIAVILTTGTTAARGDGNTPDKFVGKIESTYAATGPYETTYDSVTGLRCYYPKTKAGKFPIIVWANGSHNSKQPFAELCRHFASWGFLVVVPNSTISGSGKEILDAIDYLVAQHNAADSKYFGKLIVDKIGLSGHALGASASINAAADARITCVAPVAPAPARASKVNGPMFLVLAAHQSPYSPEMVRHTIYSNSKVATIFGTITTGTDSDFIPDGGIARGYLTAWFRYLLQNDAEAKTAFLDECELCKNTNWQVERKRRAITPIPLSK